MKTILILALLATLLTSAFYLFQSNQTFEELQAYEEDAKFENGILYWNLQDKGLDNQQVISIGKSIGRGRIQKWTGTNNIYGIDINLSKNSAISDITEILQGITKGLSQNLKSIVITIDNDGFNWDPSFMGWVIPQNVTQFTFTASTNSSNSYDNLTKAIVNAPQQLTTLKISIFNNSFSSVYKLFEEIKNVQTSVQEFKYDFGYNYSSANTSTFQSNFNEFLENNASLTDVYIGLGKESVNTSQLNQIESILYDRVESRILKKITLDLRENNLDKSKVEEIFADIKDFLGNNLKIFI